jgi:hypothetical protein
MNRSRIRLVAPLLAASCLLSCNDASQPPPRIPPPPAMPSASATDEAAPAQTTQPPYAQLDRAAFNKAAVRLNLPLYWTADLNANRAVDPDEVVTLLFYPTDTKWTAAGTFTKAFEQAYPQLVSAAGDMLAGKALDAAEIERRRLVIQDLDQGRATLVRTDARPFNQEEKTFLRHMMAVARMMDGLFAKQNGIDVLASKVPADDTASQSLFRRNWGPKCLAPLTKRNAACSAIPGGAKPLCDAYPADIQKDPKFCEALEKRQDAKPLLDPFVVVRDKGGKLQPVRAHDAYTKEMDAVATELKAAAADLHDSSEAALKAYLEAAAQSFSTNDWRAADDAWAKMNAQNSKWYLRVAPDEVYWEPCSQKAGFHMTLARINTESLQWQQKLNPVQQAMEKALADLIGDPYKERKVTFHLPDFIDIVTNAGDDREYAGATIGQSLPNWGPLVAAGKGRTVAMSNLYTDPDSMQMRRAQAESLLDAESIKAYSGQATPGLLSTILHEATHNLGPAHEYKYKGKTDAQALGGPLSSTFEELKAQTGGMWFIDFALRKGIVSAELARQTYADDLVWCFGHISRGMYSETGKREPYSQLAAIQLGFLMDEAAITFDPKARAANGKDDGAFVMHFDKLPAAIEKLMKQVGTIKATADKPAAEEFAKKYVDGDRVPHKLITDRMLRYPKASFVYAIDL